MTAADSGYAAYGMRLHGLAAVDGRGRPAAPSDWESWTVRERVGAVDDAPGMTVDARHARIGMPGAGELLIDRDARTITFVTRKPVPPEAIVHPGLVPAAAVVAWWRGHVPVHAAGVVVGQHVWGLLADREGGKSTTAALLADRGFALFADDMLVVDGTCCFAGPASVDLRPEAAQRLGGRSLGVVGQRERWRKPYPTTAIEAPLAGWVELLWSDDHATRVVECEVGDRIGVLGHHASLPLSGDQLLDLALAPMLRFARPRSLEAAEASAEALAAALAQR